MARVISLFFRLFMYGSEQKTRAMRPIIIFYSHCNYGYEPPEFGLMAKQFAFRTHRKPIGESIRKTPMNRFLSEWDISIFLPSG
jgi:hypothetical protein